MAQNQPHVEAIRQRNQTQISDKRLSKHQRYHQSRNKDYNMMVQSAVALPPSEALNASAVFGRRTDREYRLIRKKWLFLKLRIRLLTYQNISMKKYID
jgi:hypothetical protein